jgi:hypothetical protein
MLLRPHEGNGGGTDVATLPARDTGRIQVVLTAGTAQFTTCFATPPGDRLLHVEPPTGAEAAGAGLSGAPVELRWRTPAGVACGRGTVHVDIDDPDAPWVVELAGTVETREERLFRRVPVRVPVSLMLVRGGQAHLVAARSVNVSVGGMAVEFDEDVSTVEGEAVVVGIDPSEGRVLAGGTVISSGSADEPLRIRFDQISAPQQDRLVGFINREELRCSLR